MTGSASGGDVWPEVAPSGVGLFDQGDLPGAVPVFELFFATDGGRHVVVKFKVNQQVHAVFLRKGFCGIIAMLPDALRQIARNANVQGAVLAARESVDSWLFHPRRLCSVCVFGKAQRMPL